MNVGSYMFPEQFFCYFFFSFKVSLFCISIAEEYKFSGSNNSTRVSFKTILQLEG